MSFTINNKMGYSNNIDAETLRLLNLTNTVKDVECFEYEGCFYIGNKVDACKRFCESTSYPADFHVWLQNNYPQTIIVNIK